jgi:hypothetical protein
MIPFNERIVQVNQVNQANRAIAHTIQTRSPGWMVMWSMWRQKFSAFSCWTAPRCVVIDAPTVEDLIHEMQLIMIEHWQQGERRT